MNEKLAVMAGLAEMEQSPRSDAAAQRALHIGILGTRGIPAAYGGFETFAEELSKRLVQRGHTVTVYGRRFPGEGGVVDQRIDSVQLRRTLTVRHKYLETPLAALTSFMDVLGRKVDIILLCNAANSPFAWIPKLGGIPLAINVDGIERERRKWSAVGRLWYKLGERSSVWFANRVVADAEVIAAYYRERHGIHPAVIAYGAEPRPLAAGATLKKYALTPGRYILYVSRLEPENNALGVVQAYTRLNTTMPLVVVGDAPYAKEYIAEIKRAANERVVFTGFQFGESYRELRSHCYLYVQASEVGGTHPALVEAMAYGNCVIANDVPEHREVLGAAGLYYPKNDFAALSSIMARLIGDPSSVDTWRAKARERALSNYSWDLIVSQYERLFLEILASQKTNAQSHQ